MVGLAATSLIYEKWFRINNYYINQLVTTLIGSAGCWKILYSFKITDFCKSSLLKVGHWSGNGF